MKLEPTPCQASCCIPHTGVHGEQYWYFPQRRSCTSDGSKESNSFVELARMSPPSLWSLHNNFFQLLNIKFSLSFFVCLGGPLSLRDQLSHTDPFSLSDHIGTLKSHLLSQETYSLKELHFHPPGRLQVKTDQESTCFFPPHCEFSWMFLTPPLDKSAYPLPGVPGNTFLTMCLCVT